MKETRKSQRFPFSGTSPDSFYGMPRNEAKQLKRLLSRSGSVVLVEGPRRIGKTSLVISSVTAKRLVKANLYGAKNLEQCSMLLAGAIEEYTGASLNTENTTSLKGSIWALSASKTVKSSPSGDLLKIAFDALILSAEKAAKSPTLFIDEIQTVLGLEDGLNFAKRLRTEIQRSLHCISVVFAGSDSEALNNLHAPQTSPFYKQFEPLPLNALPRDEFHKWINARLSQDGSKIEQEAFQHLAEFCRDVPGDIQRILASIYTRIPPRTTIKGSHVLQAIERICDSLKTAVISINSQLNEKQLSLYLLLSARTRLEANLPLTGKLAQRLTDLSSGGIHRNLEALSRRQLLTHNGGQIYPDDPFIEKILADTYQHAYQSIVDQIRS